MTENVDFSTPQRQSLLGVIVYILKNGRALLSAFVVLYAALAKNPEYGNYIWLGLGALVVFILILSYLQYLNFTFAIKDDEIVIHSGVIFKERKNIPFDRIQSVHIQQNIFQRILQVVGLKIDSAGSKNKELEISALTSATATALQQILESGSKVIPDQTQPDELREAKIKTELVKLSIGDLLRVGLTENHIRNGLIAVAVVWSYFSQYSEYLTDYIDDNVENYLPDVFRLGMIIVFLGVGVFLIASVLLSVIRTILQFFNFHAWLEGSTVRIDSGLLKRNQYRIPANKIQYLVWKSNPLRRILGFSTVLIKQAQSANEIKKNKIEIPACYENQSRDLENLVFGYPVSEGRNILNPNLLSYLLIWTYIGLLLSAVCIFNIFLITDVLNFLPLLSLPVFWFFAYKYARSVNIDLQEDLVVIKKGWVFPKRVIVPYYKTQSIAFSQNIFLKRRKLAHCRIYTASGSVSLHFLPEQAVKEICDFTLYKVESHNGTWM